MSASSLELAFETAWRQIAGPDAPAFVTQHRFAPPRRWRFDVAWERVRVAVELHGGTWIQGRHNRAAGISTDAEKNNAAVERGWVVLVFTTPMLKDDPAGCVEQVMRVLAARGGSPGAPLPE